tara:strand:+ start:208 stop:492 length:285 start_codon:yes stop_codon:yes gene_type:complete
LIRQIKSKKAPQTKYLKCFFKNNQSKNTLKTQYIAIIPHRNQKNHRPKGKQRPLATLSCLKSSQKKKKYFFANYNSKPRCHEDISRQTTQKLAS